MTGGSAVYARTDQLIAGLERAVDPNVDGDAHDAARVALIGEAVSYAAFADSPEARAIQGALDLDTLVVAPAGNDGPAGPGYGSVSSPGGAPAALTVGGGRPARVRRGGARRCPGRARPGARPAAAARRRGRLRPSARARARGAAAPDASGLRAFFDPKGRSLVANRAALVDGGSDPQLAIEYAARAGANAVVVYGTQLPAGGLGVDEAVNIPVVSVPRARRPRPRSRRCSAHRHPAVSIGLPTRGAQRERRRDRPVLLARPRLRRARQAGPGRARRRARRPPSPAPTTTARRASAPSTARAPPPPWSPAPPPCSPRHGPACARST